MTYQDDREAELRAHVENQQRAAQNMHRGAVVEVASLGQTPAACAPAMPVLAMVGRDVMTCAERALALSERLEQLSARVRGPAPPINSTAQADTPGPGGHLNMIRTGLAALDEALNRLDMQVNGLEELM